MDESIRVYNPRGSYLIAERSKKQTEVKHVLRKSYKGTLREVLDEQKRREKDLKESYPIANLFYKYGFVFVVIVLIISSIVCGVRSNTEKVAVAYAEAAVADYQAEEQMKADQIELERKKAEQSEAILEHNIVTKLARMYQCADKFVDKYGYSERDFKTLGRCVFNRVENPAYPDDIIEVIDQANQWVGYNSSMTFTPMTKYYEMAQRHYREWKAETTKPISNDYLWAEYTAKGIFLKYQYDAGTYDPRWRADA